MSRGGGPEHRFVKAIHPSALNGDLRVTEQGEAIEQKYANRLTAVYNLELLFAGVARATLLDWHCPEPAHVLEPTLDWLAERSRADLRRAAADRRVSRILPPGHADRRHRGEPHRLASLAPDGAARARRSARHPVGVQLEPGPLLPAGMVRRGRGARSAAGRTPAGVRAVAGALVYVGAAALRAEQRRHLYCGGRPRGHGRVRRARRGRRVWHRASSRRSPRSSIGRRGCWSGSIGGRWPNAGPTSMAPCRCARNRFGFCTTSRSHCSASGEPPVAAATAKRAAALLPALLLTVNAIASGLGATG